MEPVSLKPGESGMLYVSVTNQGGSTAVTGRVKIVTDNFLAVLVKEKSALIGLGKEITFDFSITAGITSGVSTLRIELYDQDGILIESRALQVTISSLPPSIPPPILTPKKLLVDWWVWLLLGLVGVAAVVAGLWIRAPVTDTLLPLGFGLIIFAVGGYALQEVLLTTVSFFGIDLVVWQIFLVSGILLVVGYIILWKVNLKAIAKKSGGKIAKKKVF